MKHEEAATPASIGRSSDRAQLLEDKPQPKLHLTRRLALRQLREASCGSCNRRNGDAVNGDIAGINRELSVCRCVVILNIEHVERLKTELQAYAFPDRYVLEHGEVHVHYVRSIESIPA